MRGSIEKRGPKRWKARYYGPDGKQRSRTFERKVDAERFLAAQAVSRARGEWIDPSLGKMTVAEWAERWLLTTGRLKPKTRAGYESLVRVHVLPHLGGVPLAHLDSMGVWEWLGQLHAQGLSPSRVRQAYRVLSLLCKAAVESGRISSTPCVGVRLPRIPPGVHIVISEEQVVALAEACTGYSELIYVLAYGGLRWGEAVGLRKRNVDILGARLHVVETLSEVGGHLHSVLPKTYMRRYVALPRFVAEMLGPHCAGDPDERVFTSPRGRALRDSHFRLRVWRPALSRLGDAVPLQMTPHHLRHTCASLLVARGASVKAVQTQLGHASPTITLNTYTHLFVDDLDGLWEGHESPASPDPTPPVTDLDAMRGRNGS
jgi:integrase